MTEYNKMNPISTIVHFAWKLLEYSSRLFPFGAPNQDNVKENLIFSMHFKPHSILTGILYKLSFNFSISIFSLIMTEAISESLEGRVFQTAIYEKKVDSNSTQKWIKWKRLC